MLHLIGLGLVDGDVTVRGIETMKKCDDIYCELYTNRWMGDMKALGRKVKKKILILSRQDVESDFLLDKAGKKDVALLISGDPMTATTHFQLIFDAKKRGIPYEIIHAPSIYTSIADTGLQLYKFGRTTTLAYPEKNFSPSSPYEAIEMNRGLGLHTLVLLDIKEDRQMSVKEGIEILLKMKKEKNVLPEKLVACCKVGSKEQTIKYGTAISLMKDPSLRETPACLIIPGELNFKEEEALELWK